MDTGSTTLLLHAIKAIQYRIEKALLGADDTFGNFKAGPQTRTPAEILNHMYDLVNKTVSRIKDGHFNCPLPEPLDFTGEKERLHQGLETAKTILLTHQPQEMLVKKLLQGPILDMATHVGQLAMLRGCWGYPVPKEKYFEVVIT